MSFIAGTILNPDGHALLPNGSRPRLSIKLLQFVENPVPFFAHTPDTARKAASFSVKCRARRSCVYANNCNVMK
jgi:hypothetical protein